jgi:hypothetical protein
MNHDTTVIGIFETAEAARQAIATLQARSADLAIRDVSVVERDPQRYAAGNDYGDSTFEYREYSTEELGDETASGLVLGSLLGGTLGTLAGLGALVIPGVGPVLAAGPLLGALVGGTAGAVTGTLAGALIEAFEVPEEHATIYRERLAQGRTMVAVQVDAADAAAVRDILRDANAERFDWGDRYDYPHKYDNYHAWPKNVREEERQPYLWV